MLYIRLCWFVRNTNLVTKSKRKLEFELSIPVLLGFNCRSSNQRPYLRRPTHSAFVWSHMVGGGEKRKI